MSYQTVGLLDVVLAVTAKDHVYNRQCGDPVVLFETEHGMPFEFLNLVRFARAFDFFKGSHQESSGPACRIVYDGMRSYPDGARGESSDVPGSP